MKNGSRKKKIIRAMEALRGNSGAGLIVVLITAMFVLILGGALLYASYNVYMMRVAERKAQTNFTSADAGMEEIRAGLQTAMSDATGAGYDNVIMNYTTGGTTATFNDGFFKAMNDWTAEAALADGSGRSTLHLFKSSSGLITNYNVAVLNSFLDQPVGDATYTLSAVTTSGEEVLKKDHQNSDLWGDAVQDTAKGSITLKGIKLNYKKGGYETTITTDIYLSVPDVPVNSAVNTSNIADYVIVADRGVEVTENGKQLTIKGDMYAGKLNVKNGGHATIEDNCTMVIGRTLILGSDGKPKADPANPGTYERTTGDVTLDGTVKYDNMGKFNGGQTSFLDLKNNAKLWTHEVSVNGASLSMAGGDKTGLYVADDLNIGRYASARLQGSYFGFGNGTALPGEDIVTSANLADFSSAILFRTRGQNAGFLDMTGLSSLTLAGTSFVQPKQTGDSSIRMGSSISSRSEQLAYLVPAGSLGGRSNPEIRDEDKVTPAEESAAIKEAVLTKENQKKPLWAGSGDTLATYGISSADRITVMSYPLAGSNQRVYYTFMNFPDRDTANRYFQAFFDQNPDTVNQYLNQYISMQGSPAERTMGTALKKDGDKYVVTRSSINVESDVATSCAKYQTVYRNLSRTMTTNSADLTTPFNYYIDKDKLNEIIDRDGNGGNTAEIKFSYDNGDDGYIVLARGTYDVHLSTKQPIVICDGDVTVQNSDMIEGLIICSGEIKVSSDLTILKDQASGRDPLTKILKDKGQGVWKGGGSVEEPEADTWSADDTVKFTNWKKNAA